MALLGLSYNHESEGAEYVKPGNVKISMLEHYTQTDLSKSLQVPLQYQEEYTAHLYGNSRLILSIFAQIIGDSNSPSSDGRILDLCGDCK